MFNFGPIVHSVNKPLIGLVLKHIKMYLNGAHIK